MTPERLAEIRRWVGSPPYTTLATEMIADLLAAYDAIADGSAVRSARASERDAVRRAGDAEERAEWLGRILDAAAAERDAWRAKHDTLAIVSKACIATAEGERDEALKKAERLIRENVLGEPYNMLLTRAEKAERERDDARAALAAERTARGRSEHAWADERDAMKAERDHWRAIAEQRWAMRREIEEALGVTSEDASGDAMAKGLAAIASIKARALREAAETFTPIVAANQVACRIDVADAWMFAAQRLRAMADEAANVVPSQPGVIAKITAPSLEERVAALAARVLELEEAELRWVEP